MGAGLRITVGHSLVGTLLLAGCSGIGPGMVSRNRFDYTSAVADSWKSQMLLNLVKIRYGDTPVFLDVASIISQYELEGTFSATGTLFDARGAIGFATQSLLARGPEAAPSNWKRLGRDFT